MRLKRLKGIVKMMAGVSFLRVFFVIFLVSTPFCEGQKTKRDDEIIGRLMKQRYSLVGSLNALKKKLPENQRMEESISNTLALFFYEYWVVYVDEAVLVQDESFEENVMALFRHSQEIGSFRDLLLGFRSEKENYPADWQHELESLIVTRSDFVDKSRYVKSIEKCVAFYSKKVRKAEASP